ncbi:hypothetical protein GS940_22060 [Rhodococcus hoagii]|nr:hypothetical protein [Prescottella equi]
MRTDGASIAGGHDGAAAAEAAEDQLFPILVDMGTRQRSEMNRLHSLRHDPLPTTAADQA